MIRDIQRHRPWISSGWGDAPPHLRNRSYPHPLTIYIFVPYDKTHLMAPTGDPPGYTQPLQFTLGLLSRKLIRTPPLNHIYFSSLCRYGNEVLQVGFKESSGGMPYPLHFIKAVQIPTSLPYIFLFLIIRCNQ